MPSRKTKSEDAVSVVDDRALHGTLSNGLDEAPAQFEYQSADEIRFAESVALMRSFSLIDDDADRQQVIALAKRLAERD